MKFGIRTPSLKGRVSSRLSLKRVARHRLGLKAPRGFGFATNPKKALYNRVYNKTSVSVDRLAKSSGKHQRSDTASTTDSNASCGYGCLAFLAICFAIAFPPAIIFFIVGLIIYFKLPNQRAKAFIKGAKYEAEKGNLDAAILKLKKAQEIKPNDESINYLFGAIYNNFKKYKEAIPYLEKFYKIDNSSTIRLLLAISYFQTGEYSKAIPLLQLFNEEEAEFIHAIGILGICLKEEGKTDAAIEAFKRAPLGKRNLDEFLVEIHYNLGELYEKKKDRLSALRHFNRVCSHDAGFKDVAKKIEKLSKKNK